MMTTMLANAGPLWALPSRQRRENDKSKPELQRRRHHHHQQQQRPSLGWHPQPDHIKRGNPEPTTESPQTAQPKSSASSTCDNFTVNSQTIDFKLRWVERCLLQLVREETADEFADSTEPCEQTVRCNRESLKIKTVLRIYAKLLRCPPPLDAIVLTVPLSCPRPSKCIESARQRVLSLIERLAGYCDSINSLRCILKSGHVIAVISSFDAILEKIRDVSSQECQYVPQVEDSHEFRIVQEWRF